MEPPKEVQKRRFQIEKLEERIAPSNGNFPPGQFPSGRTDGILSVDPPGVADSHSMDHLHPTVGVGGLNTAEARSGVVNWTPTK